MKKILVLLFAVVAVAAASSYLTTKLAQGCGCAAESSGSTASSLVEELKLNAEQKKAVEAIDTRFAETSVKLQAAMREANRDLGQALAEGRPDNPAIAASIDRIHHHMGELQKASIAHLFELRSVLTPEQGNILLKHAREALVNCH